MLDTLLIHNQTALSPVLMSFQSKEGRLGDRQGGGIFTPSPPRLVFDLLLLLFPLSVAK